MKSFVSFFCLLILTVNSAHSDVLEVMWGNILYGQVSSSHHVYEKETANLTPAERSQLQFYWAKMNMMGWSSKKLGLKCLNSDKMHLFSTNQSTTETSSFELAKMMIESHATKIRTTPGTDDSFEITLDDNSYHEGEKVIKSCRFYTSFPSPVDPGEYEAVHREGNGVMDNGGFTYHKKIVGTPTITKVDCGMRYPEKIIPLKFFYHSLSKCELNPKARIQIEEWFQNPSKDGVDDTGRNHDLKNDMPSPDRLLPRRKNMPTRPKVRDEGVEAISA